MFSVCDAIIAACNAKLSSNRKFFCTRYRMVPCVGDVRIKCGAGRNVLVRAQSTAGHAFNCSGSLSSLLTSLRVGAIGSGCDGLSCENDW